MSEQFIHDYSAGYQSPQQHVHDGTGKVFAIVAFGLALSAVGGVLVGAILIPEIVQSRANEAAARAVAKSEYAERDARVALDKLGYIQAELAKKGFNISLDGH